MRKLGPWISPIKSEFNQGGNGKVRYPAPLDGRTWDLDGTPRWIALVSSCCGPTENEPDRKFHYDWTVDQSDSASQKSIRSGNTVRTSFEDAMAEADAYMLSLGYVLDN